MVDGMGVWIVDGRGDLSPNRKPDVEVARQVAGQSACTALANLLDILRQLWREVAGIANEHCTRTRRTAISLVDRMAARHAVAIRKPQPALAMAKIAGCPDALGVGGGRAVEQRLPLELFTGHLPRRRFHRNPWRGWRYFFLPPFFP